MHICVPFFDVFVNGCQRLVESSFRISENEVMWWSVCVLTPYICLKVNIQPDTWHVTTIKHWDKCFSFRHWLTATELCQNAYKHNIFFFNRLKNLFLLLLFFGQRWLPCYHSFIVLTLVFWQLWLTQAVFFIILFCVYVQAHNKPLFLSTFTLHDVLSFQFAVTVFFPFFNKCMLCTCVWRLELYASFCCHSNSRTLIGLLW